MYSNCNFNRWASYGQKVKIFIPKTKQEKFPRICVMFKTMKSLLERMVKCDF